MFFGGPSHVELDPRYTGTKELTSTEPVWFRHCFVLCIQIMWAHFVFDSSQLFSNITSWLWSFCVFWVIFKCILCSWTVPYLDINLFLLQMYKMYWRWPNLLGHKSAMFEPYEFWEQVQPSFLENHCCCHTLGATASSNPLFFNDVQRLGTVKLEKIRRKQYIGTSNLPGMFSCMLVS